MKRRFWRWWYRHDVSYRLRRVWERAIGWRLALWLDKRHPDWCWAELATSLAMGWSLRDWRERAKAISICQRDCERNGSCWCGKLMTPAMRERFEAELILPENAP